MRILLIGHGRMGRLVEALAPEHDATIAAIVDRGESIARAASNARADIAIDFSLPDAVPSNLEQLAAAGLNTVIGVTGWKEHELALRSIVDRSGIGVLASANFAVGLHVFRRAVAEAATRFEPQQSYGAWIHEAHHAQKKDAPSGTALMLADAIRGAGFTRPIDISSTRAGAVPGTHTVGFEGPSDSVTLTHTVRDRAVFAHGALEAARWLRGRRGWLSMDDFLEAQK